MGAHEWQDRLVELGEVVVERLPAVLVEVRELLAEEQADYAQFLIDEYDEVVTVAPAFVRKLVREASGELPARAEEGVQRMLFEEIGRMHQREGRDVTGLLAAYQTGATALWRAVSGIAVERGLPAQACAGLASAVFAAVSRLSSASLDGYLQEQADAVAARDRRREELAQLLLSDRSDRAAVRRAAELAGWPLPRRAGVVLAEPDNEVARAVMARLDSGCLHLWRPDARIAVVPDPDGPCRRERITATLRGAGAVVGPSVELDGLPGSLRLAELAVRVHRTGVITDDPLFVEQHLGTIIVHQDGALLDSLRRRCLEPLSGLTAPTRERLEATLRSWLQQMGDRQAIAAELHVHPQTVSYRIAQLRELFGAGLDDPRLRSDLLLALAWGPAHDVPEPVAARR